MLKQPRYRSDAYFWNRSEIIGCSHNAILYRREIAEEIAAEKLHPKSQQKSPVWTALYTCTWRQLFKRNHASKRRKCLKTHCCGHEAFEWWHETVRKLKRLVVFIVLKSASVWIGENNIKTLMGIKNILLRFRQDKTQKFTTVLVWMGLRYVVLQLQKCFAFFF